MDKHVIVTLFCALLYLIVIATIETVSIMNKYSLETTKNEIYTHKVGKNFSFSISNGDLIDVEQPILVT